VAKQKIKTERINMKVAPELKRRIEDSAQECNTNVNVFMEVAAVEKMDRMDDDKLKGWLDS
jgi:uncharacterized protein (DUF1778 family)